MNKGDDPYEILGVTYDATEDEIKKSYRKGALKFHPDKQSNATEEEKKEAADVFARLSAAYDTLTDPVKRYDWKQANEAKMKRSSSMGATVNTGGAKPAPRPAPPRRQNTEPAPSPSYNQTRKTPQPGPKRAAPPPPSNGFPSWARSPKPNPHSASAAKAGKAKSQAAKTSTTQNTSSANSYPSAAATGKREDPRAPNSSYGGAGTGMKEDFRSPAANKNSKKKATLNPPGDTFSYSGTGVGQKEDLRAPKSASGRKKKRASAPAVPSSPPMSSSASSNVYSGAGVGIKEDLRSPNPGSKKRTPKKGSSWTNDERPTSAYSIRGTNGQPIDRTYTPKGTRRSVGLNSFLDPPPLSGGDGDDATVQTTQTGVTRNSQRSGRRTRPQTRSVSPIPKNKATTSSPKGSRRKLKEPQRSSSDRGRGGGGLDNSNHSFASFGSGRRAKSNSRVTRSQSPRKGRTESLGSNVRRAGARRPQGGNVNDVHDPFETFDKFVRLEFSDEDFVKNNTKGDWVGKGLFGDKKETKLKAKALEFYDPNAVMSMSTSTKTEKRESGGLYDVKTITKILRGDGSVETVRQASVCDKEHAKTIPKDKTVTVTREIKNKKKK